MFEVYLLKLNPKTGKIAQTVELRFIPPNVLLTQEWMQDSLKYPDSYLIGYRGKFDIIITKVTRDQLRDFVDEFNQYDKLYSKEEVYA